MKTSFTLLFCAAHFFHVISCGLIPLFSLIEKKPLLNNSIANVFTLNEDITTLPPTPNEVLIFVNLTTVIDQIIVPKAAIANASDILKSTKNEITTSNMSADVSTTTSSTSIIADEHNETTTMDANEIVVPKQAIDNSTLELAIARSPSPLSTVVVVVSQNATVEEGIVVAKAVLFGNDTQLTNGSPATSETVEPNQGLGPISVHKRSVLNDSAVSEFDSEYPDTSSLLFEKYDKWTGPGAITSQEIRELKQKGIYQESTTASDKKYGLMGGRRKKRQNSDEMELERGSNESSEDEVLTEDEKYKKTLQKAITSQESNELRNWTTTTDVPPSNATDTTTEEHLENVNRDGLKNDVVDDDDSVCAVNKDDEEATKVVTIFWRSVFCVIFIIIIVYPIYSYTKIYCQKRRRDAESISNERFVGSDSEISNTTNDCPTPTTPTTTPTPTSK